MSNTSEPLARLERMMLIRTFEERVAALTAEEKAPGTCTSVGQEAAAVGVVQALEAHDLIVTAHRSAGHLLARGADPGRLLAEIMGRASGYCQGKSGSLHVSVKELGVILTSTIVGAQLSLATGVGMSVAMHEQSGQRADTVVACLFGDGAACEGIFHESINLAAVWKLPILYFCENNQWQAYVRRDETMLTEHIADRAAAYGVKGVTVDGNDVEAVHQAATEAIATVRREHRPILLEAMTYRLRGHYEPDPAAYVDADELAQWKLKDPITTMTRRLTEAGTLDADGAMAMEARCTEAIDAAVEFASNAPFPAVEELLTDVYA